MTGPNQHPQPRHRKESDRVAVICGGVGAARFLKGLLQVMDPANVDAIVNVADDMVLHGLHISPDIDTVVYTLADEIDPERGWGLRDETWNAMASIRRFGDGDWFSLGDRDLATHMHRTQRLRDGASLTDVTAEISAAFGVPCRILPATNGMLRTKVQLADSGDEIDFQRYFVELKHDVPISGVRFAGMEDAQVSDDVADALRNASATIIAPSNPFVSIAPVLSIPGVDACIERDRTTAISPIVGGAAIKGPAGRMLEELGYESSCVGVADNLADVAATMLIDDQDASLAAGVAARGITPRVCNTMMTTPKASATLARNALSASGRGRTLGGAR